MKTSELDALAERYAQLLEKHYEPGFGISPAAEPTENYYHQLWTRDFAHAAAHYFIGENPRAGEESLRTILRHQREDGALPLRVEREYMLLKMIPGLRFLARTAFVLLEGRMRGRTERPVYTKHDFSFAEDTVPATLIAAGMFYESSEEGRVFIQNNIVALLRACDHFSQKADPADGLVSVERGTVDWADSILHGGKLGLLNVIWVRGLELMLPVLAPGDSAAHERIQALHAKARASLLQKLYDADGAYFRATEGEDRIDTAATALGALFFLDAAECVRVEETLSARVKHPSGLANFNPRYPSRDILWPFKVIMHQEYHNSYIWPWVTLQNIHVKIKIAQTHQSAEVRERYKKEAVGDLYDTASLFEDAGGAYEIFFPDTRKPADTHWYHPPRNFMANLVSFESVYLKLKRLGWLAERS